jgi:hypothetical protein
MIDKSAFKIFTAGRVIAYLLHVFRTYNKIILNKTYDTRLKWYTYPSFLLILLVGKVLRAPEAECLVQGRK